MPVLLVVIMSALSIALIGSLGFNVFQAQHAEQERQVLTSEITDLRYALNKSEKTTPSPTPSSAPSPSPTPTPTPTVSPSPTPVLGATDTAPKTASTTARVNLRDKPQGGSIIGKLPSGTTVTLGALAGEMQEVTAGDKHGYVDKRFLKY